MNTLEITMVRIYCTEAEHKLQGLLDYLHDQAGVRGVTVFRGITGFGRSGKLHTASLVDLALDLPVVVEFFDVPDKIASILPRLNEMFEPGHMVFWQAKVNA